MIELHKLSIEERNLYFRTAAAESNISQEIIEKDFWVVWTLARLFAMEDLKDHLTFKGGTSLSKVYELIERFSEDIDISIEKTYLGFDKENDPEKAPSRKKQRAAIEALGRACSEYVTGKMLTELKDIIGNRLGTNTGWNLIIDEQDNDRQTLLFEYPTSTPKERYIRPFVKIEIGARSDHWPVSMHKIQSYAKTTLKEKVHEDDVEIRALDAERTFWEKATILHAHAHLADDKNIPVRTSRHFYDFFRLLNSDVKAKAEEQDALLERVAHHKGIYFASTQANYATAKRGTLKLNPLKRVLPDLEEDYRLMSEMFFRTQPEWKEILNAIAAFEKEFNEKGIQGYIIVNGRKKEYQKDKIGYDELVHLAFENPPTGENVLFTISYRNGPAGSEEGTLITGHTLAVKAGMIFNVTSTDKS